MLRSNKYKFTEKDKKIIEGIDEVNNDIYSKEEPFTIIDNYKCIGTLDIPKKDDALKCYGKLQPRKQNLVDTLKNMKIGEEIPLGDVGTLKEAVQLLSISEGMSKHEKQ